MPVPYYDWAAGHAAIRPDAMAQVDIQNGRSYTYAEMDERSARLGRWLQDRGVGRGDRVAILAYNGPEFFELEFAAGKTGAVMVPLNWRLAQPELEYILGDCAPKVLIHDVEFTAMCDALRHSLQHPARPRHRRGERGQSLRRRAGLGAAGAGNRGADPRRPGDDHVHLRHHRAAQGRDDHAPDAPVQLHQPGLHQPALAGHDPARRAAAVPYRRAQLLHQPGAARRRPEHHHARVRAGRRARLYRRPGAGHHPLLRRAGALPVHDAGAEFRDRGPVAPRHVRRRRRLLPGADPGSLARPRHTAGPGLGHDRDQPGRPVPRYPGYPPQGRIGRQAGHAHRDQDRRRHGQRRAAAARPANC